MNRLLTAAAILALPAAALAQSPVAVERPDAGKGFSIGHQQMELPADVLVDQLWIVDTDAVDYGNGAAISGTSIFGVVYDLQLSDPFEVPGDMDITRVVTDFLNFNGSPYTPATDVLVEFFADAGGGFAAELPTFQMTGTVHAESDIYVGWWGGGTRIEVAFSGEVNLSAGIWWVSLTPVDTTSSGDWYYACRSAVSGLMDSNLRDGGEDHGSLYGGPYDGGYDTTDWITAGSFGYPGTTSFLVEGEAESGFVLTLYGDCPGMMEICVSGATPNGPVGFVYGYSCGSSEALPDCPGVFYDIDDPELSGMATADGNGEACLSGYIPPSGCGLILVQAIDLDSCTVSNVELIGGELPDLCLQVSGECPGMMTVTVTGASPYSDVAFAWSKKPGSSEIPECPGVFLDIDNANRIAVVAADENGEASFEGYAPPAACGRVLLQAADLLECTTSNVVGI